MTQRIKQTFDLKDLHNDEEQEFHTEILKLAAHVEPAAVGAEDIAALYAAALRRLDAAALIGRGSALTPEIKAVRAEMMRAYGGLSLAVAAAGYDADPDRAAGGASLRRVLDKFKNARSANYEASAADILFVVEEFRSAGYAGIVAGGGLGGWVDALEESLAEFRALVMKRHVETGGVPKSEVKKARALCRHYWTALRDRVNSRIYIGAAENPAVGTFAGAAQDVIHRYAVVAKSPGRRKGGGGGDRTVFHPAERPPRPVTPP